MPLVLSRSTGANHLKQALVDVAIQEVAGVAGSFDQKRRQIQQDDLGTEGSNPDLCLGLTKLSTGALEVIQKLRRFQIPDPSEGIVKEGLIVTVESGKAEQHLFLLPGARRLDYCFDGIQLTICDSLCPIAQGLIGKRVGETVMIQTPGGSEKFYIKNVS